MSKSKWGPTWTTNLSNKKESHSYKIGSDQSITSRTEEDTVNFCPNCVLLQCRKEDWEQACVHGGSQLLTHHSIGSGRWSSVGSKPACSIQQVPMKHYLEKKTLHISTYEEQILSIVFGKISRKSILKIK